MPVPETIIEKYPLMKQWLEETLQRYSPQAKNASELGFKRLPSYCSRALLQLAKVVVVDQLPMPPLSKWGLTTFRYFEHEPFVGTTFKDMIFILPKEASNEAAIFHNLVHVAQWQHLGDERFLYLYVKGLLEEMYYTSPLEMMAFKYQEEFENKIPPYNMEERVHKALDELLKSSS